MDQAKDAETGGRVEERREGVTEGDFRTRDLVSYCSTFSGMEVPCATI
jgi:hypothetical protein